jgi:hypothetical protein
MAAVAAERAVVRPTGDMKPTGGVPLQRHEWLKVVQLEQALWPHSKFPDEAMMIQYEFVKDVPFEAAMTAVKALATREHAPNAAMIAKQAAELLDGDLPGWDEVRPALMSMLAKGFDANRAPTQIDWERNGFHAILAAYFTPQRWRLWCLTDEHDTTFNAQQRDDYRAMCGRSEKELALLAAGVNRSEIGRGLRQLDPIAALRLVEGESA